eukprot:GHRQ01038212.1.p3 GENE.GHRQ01038212.1~~GHRQ01038212.1.p3  ORF type:complete len:159 (+),score=39.48 GHRQ01038212.1:894-1370(+)
MIFAGVCVQRRSLLSLLYKCRRPCCAQVVRAASERGREHVPYRSSKLTHVLKDSLGGNCATVLIANVWGEPAQLHETLSTCRFSARMTRLVCEVASNVVQQEGGARVRELQRCAAATATPAAALQLHVAEGTDRGRAWLPQAVHCVSADSIWLSLQPW